MPKQMVADLDDVFQRGGRELIDLLQYSVCSVQPEPLFLCLVQDYRGQATVPRALALADVFCTAGQPACLRAPAVLPPRDLRLSRELAPLRQALAAFSAAPPEAEDRPALPLPARHLFDFVVAHLREQPDGPLQRIARGYDPALSPLENLPGGRMNEAQRFFVDRVWKPRLRPQLVAAGFCRVAAIGG
jgi:hypothetical protein